MGKVELTLTVKGLRYRVTAETMRIMSDVIPLAARLEREEGNQFDENAVKVILMDKPWKDFHLGYLARSVAAEIAPMLDNSTLEIKAVSVVSIDPDEGEGEILIDGRKRKSLQKKVI